MSRRGEIEVLSRGVLVSRGHVLVCRTGKADITYLPGGHVEFRESAAAGLRRELLEEMGVRVRVGPFLGGMEHTFLQKGRRHCEINLVFRISAAGLTPPRPPRSREGHLGFEWLPLSGLAKSDLEPGPLREMLPRWLRAPATPCRWGETYAAAPSARKRLVPAVSGGWRRARRG